MWRRIDVEGFEACAINETESGILISGAALYSERGRPVRLEYTINCDGNWESSAATIDRWVGADLKQIELKRLDDGGWAVNGRDINDVAASFDIDLGFTPVTNTIAINRLNLGIGESSGFTAVWLDDQTWTFKPLKQRYARLSETIYRYVSVDSGYEADLTVDEFGFVRNYPDLWDAVMD